MPSPPSDDLEARVRSLEVAVDQLRGEVVLGRTDATAARELAAGADRDVSEVRAELRAHTQALKRTTGESARPTDRATARLRRDADWNDPAAFDRWADAHLEPWLADRPDGVGRWIEAVRPDAAGFETISFPTECADEVAALGTAWSGEIQEHAYWGGKRDRMPRSQTDPMRGDGGPTVEGDGDRVRVRAGMDFLCTDGLSIGCCTNRYLTVLSRGGGRSDHYTADEHRAAASPGGQPGATTKSGAAGSTPTTSSSDKSLPGPASCDSTPPNPAA